MSDKYGRLINVSRHGVRLYGTCPSCGSRGEMDKDQYEGVVSLDCPNKACDYHETNDHREYVKGV